VGLRVTTVARRLLLQAEDRDLTQHRAGTNLSDDHRGRADDHIQRSLDDEHEGIVVLPFREQHFV
jgi:hypothetical protein